MKTKLNAPCRMNAQAMLCIVSLGLLGLPSAFLMGWRFNSFIYNDKIKLTKVMTETSMTIKSTANSISDLLIAVSLFLCMFQLIKTLPNCCKENEDENND